MAWRVSGFLDESAVRLSGQVDLADRWGLDAVELRLAGGRPVVRWSDRAVSRASRQVADAGLAVSSIATGIGKIGIGAELEPLVDDLKRAAEIAHRMGTPFVRVFSFLVPDADAPARRGEVLDRMAAFAAVAESEHVILLHENEKGTWGSTPKRCAEIVTAIRSPRLRLILDPANFVQCGFEPASQAYPKLRRWVELLHVKDAVAATGRVVAAGRGDGELEELVRLMTADEFDGYASLEPHLGFGGRGFPTPKSRWLEALNAFRRLLPV